MPTHTRRKKKSEDEVVDGDDDVSVPVAKSKAEKKTNQEVIAEILPAITSGGGSSKWPHEVRGMMKSKPERTVRAVAAAAMKV